VDDPKRFKRIWITAGGKTLSVLKNINPRTIPAKKVCNPITTAEKM
jgi:hypothetical protein